MNAVTMETHYNSDRDAVCQLRNVAEPQNIIWGYFFNPQSDCSIDRMADERETFLKQQHAEIVWPE